MNARVRGLIIFVVIVVFAVVFCGLVPFSIMPANTVGMALPVISVPGEVVSPGLLGGVDLTNTLVGTFLADILVIIFALLAWRASKGWTKEIPGRFQAFVEMFIEMVYNFLKNLGGDRLRNTPLLWPLVGTIFLFLLSANMLKLFPGVETVGLMHCAHPGINGYPIKQGSTDWSYQLYVDAPLDGGTPQTLETEHACEAFFDAYKSNHVERLTIAEGESVESVKSHLEGELTTLTASLATAAEEDKATIAEEIHFLEMQIASADQLIALEPVLAAQEAALEAAQDAAADESHSTDTAAAHGEEAVVAEHETAAAEGETPAEGEETAATEGETHGEEATVVETTPVAVDVAALQAQVDATQEAYNLALSGVQYPGATLALSASQLDGGAFPYIFHITPFVRGAASDLSLTVAFALMAVVLVQVYGIYALGPAYFEKFINISALGNLGSRPLGAVDFLVGLFEIISEIGKIVSLAFRLFGNIFAGGVALIAISFLVALFIPGVIMLLEIVIGAVQALVFSVLTLVFVVQAMEHHGGGDDHGHDDAHEAHH